MLREMRSEHNLGEAARESVAQSFIVPLVLAA